MLDAATYQSILIEKHDDGVVVATLNRPKKLNALGGSMRDEYVRLPLEFDGDPSAKVLVITGAGRAFCAGGDFSGDDSDGSRNRSRRLNSVRTWLRAAKMSGLTDAGMARLP